MGSVYLEGYELARFGKNPLTQLEYMDIMKHLAAILQSMGYNIKNNSESSDKSYRSSSVINHPPTDNDEDDDFSAYDEDEVRNDIYELLMKDRSS